MERENGEGVSLWNRKRLPLFEPIRTMVFFLKNRWEINFGSEFCGRLIFPAVKPPHSQAGYSRNYSTTCWISRKFNVHKKSPCSWLFWENVQDTEAITPLPASGTAAFSSACELSQSQVDSMCIFGKITVQPALWENVQDKEAMPPFSAYETAALANLSTCKLSQSKIDN